MLVLCRSSPLVEVVFWLLPSKLGEAHSFDLSLNSERYIIHTMYQLAWRVCDETFGFYPAWCFREPVHQGSHVSSSLCGPWPRHSSSQLVGKEPYSQRLHNYEFTNRLSLVSIMPADILPSDKILCEPKSKRIKRRNIIFTAAEFNWRLDEGHYELVADELLLKLCNSHSVPSQSFF